MDDPLIDHDSALEEQHDASAEKLAELHERAMQRFDEIANATGPCREQSLAARRFVSIPGAQWEGEWGDQWENSIKVEVNKVARGVEKIENDYRENRIIPDFRPDGPKADQQTADMLDGLHRADSYRFKSQQARDNAAFEAFSGGFGAWRLTNEWDDEGDKDNDHQRINPASLIRDADQSVYFDMNAALYDKADARFGFIVTAMTEDAFKDQYDSEIPDDFPDTRFSWRAIDWFRPNRVRVAEYYEREEVNDKLWVLTHKASKEERRAWASDLEDGDLAQYRRDGWATASQKRARCRVHKYILSGAEVLEDLGTIAGDCIPIVPVYGRRYFVEGIERWKGYVQDKMDVQRLYNSNVSKLAEINALSPNEVPIVTPEQMTPEIAKQWSEAHINRHAYRLLEPLRNEDGTIAIPGPTGMITPPQVAPVTAALLQIANQDLTEDQQDGADTVKSNTSAEAMDIAATRIDAKSGPYLDNMRQSVQREGEIYLSMASEVYAEEGREVQTMSEDGDDGRATLKSVYADPVTGEARIINNLDHTRYKVISSVTEATATRRDKTVRMMLQTAQVAIEAQDVDLAKAALRTAVANQDGEGLDAFQKWNRKEMLSMGLVTPNEEESKALQDEQQNQQPQPLDELAKAQAADFAASAEKKHAETGKVAADTDLSRAKTVETLAGIGRAKDQHQAGLQHQRAQTADTMASAWQKSLPPFMQRAANDRGRP